MKMDTHRQICYLSSGSIHFAGTFYPRLSGVNNGVTRENIDSFSTRDGQTRAKLLLSGF